MIDLPYYKISWLLPDGSAQLASSSGTEGSMGTVPAFESNKPHPDAKRVKFGSNYISTQRNYSPEAAEIVAEDVAWYYEFEKPNVTVSDYSGGYIAHKDSKYIENMNEWSDRLINARLYESDLTNLEDYISLFQADEDDEDAVEVSGEVEPVLVEEKVNPLVVTAKYYLQTKSPGDVLNLLMNGGLALSVALDVLKSC